MKLNKTKEAEQDLIDIYVYGFIEFGEAQREKYFASLENAFSLIQENPKIGWKRHEFQSDIRSYLHNKHLIFYTVEEEILIVRGLHYQMDVQQHLDQ